MKLFISTVISFIIFFHSTSFSDDLEYQVKSALLGKFPAFIEWAPDSNMTDTTLPFVISIIGKSPFNSADLEKMYDKVRIKNKKVLIRYISKIDEIKNSHILFICNSEKDVLDKIIAYTFDKPILTVGDTDGFAQKGVHINLYKDEGKIKFEINASSVKRSGLIVSSNLLKLARIVK